VRVIHLVVSDCLLRATTKKIVNFFEEKVHPRQNSVYAYVSHVKHGHPESADLRQGGPGRLPKFKENFLVQR